jgi:hypothetical protein
MGQVTDKEALIILEASANAIESELEEKYLRNQPAQDLYLAAMDGATLALNALRVAVIALVELKTVRQGGDA